MLSPIKTTELLSVTPADWSGSQIILDLEREIESQANERGLEVLFLLLDKLERIGTSASVEQRLNYYVSLKLARHWFRKRYYNGWGPNQMSDDVFYPKLNQLNDKIKEARRNYYVAKCG